MRSRNVLFSLVLLVVLIGIAMVRWQFYEPRRRELINREPKKLQYAQFALCHMECRNISRKDVQEVLQGGVINLNRSDRRRFPCPSFTLQGTTSSGKNIRIYLEQCSNATMILNCYNLDLEIACDCINENEKDR